MLYEKDEECLKTLFESYYKVLCVYASRYIANYNDIEDVVQEVFVSFWMNKKGTRFQGSIRAYLFGAVGKAAMKFASRNGRVIFEDIEIYNDILKDDINYWNDEEIKLLHQKLENEINDLPEKSREVFKIVVLENLTYKEVGERLGITVNTVKTLYYRAIKQLNKNLDAKTFYLLFIYKL